MWFGKEMNAKVNHGYIMVSIYLKDINECYWVEFLLKILKCIPYILKLK